MRPSPTLHRARPLIVLAGIAAVAVHWGIQPTHAQSAACPPQPAVLAQLGLGALMLALTSALQLLLTALLSDLTQLPAVVRWCKPRQHRRLLLTMAGAGLIALGLLLDMVLWALLLKGLTLFSNLETSLYFSGITFTSVGYGDIRLPGCWRLLSVAIAVNGLLIAGWSTALLVYLVQRVMDLRHQSRR